MSTLAAVREQTTDQTRRGGRVRFWSLVAAVVLVLSLDPAVDRFARQLPSIRESTAVYHIRHTLLHADKPHSRGQQSVYLIGSSIVRDDIDEALLARLLSGPRTPVHVSNFGVKGAFSLSALIVANELSPLLPGLVVWGLDARALRPSEDGLRDDARPWCRPVGTEFGATCLYGRIPGLRDWGRARSDELMLDHWALYRYRLYLRQYLAALREAQVEGSGDVFGPYTSPTQTDDPERLAAAIARYREGKARGQTDPQAPIERVHELVRAMSDVVSRRGGKLVVVWLPGALDAEEPPPPAMKTIRKACQLVGVPFIDLRGAIPQSCFRDTLHASGDGKQRITRALAPRLRRYAGGLRQDGGSLR